MKRHNVFLPEQQIDRLTELSEETGLKVAEHIRRAIDTYLASLEEGKKTTKENGPIHLQRRY